MDLASELARFGPRADFSSSSLTESERYCHRLATTHYENFTVASRLFPRHLRQHLCNVYAYCRWADDLADERVAGYQPLELLDWWEHELNAAYLGETRHPVFIALRSTITEFELPKQPFQNLLSAFRRDQNQARYDTLADLLTYCENSANPVGRVVLHLGRSVSEENLRLSDSICTGLQLANFWQDIRRDYQLGRIYIPRESWQRAGWTEQHFAAQKFDRAFANLLEPLVTDADTRLAAGLPLIEKVHRNIRLPLRLFLAGGRSILTAIRQQHYDVWTRRPTLSRIAKLRLILSALTHC